jgi:uncharacterized protein YbaR (Trm112 family)
VRSELVAWLICPTCRGELHWEMQRHNGDRIIDADVHCRDCGCSYGVRDGIGALVPRLPGETPAVDAWEQTESQLSQHLREADLSAALMEAPIDQLGPADQFLRAMVLEEQGRFDEAETALGLAEPGLYHATMRAGAAHMIEEVAWRLPTRVGHGPVIDLASGRGAMLTRLADSADLVVGTDVSLRVLRRDQRWLNWLGLADRVSLLAVDMRHIPFRDASIGVLTTNVGLDNLSPPEALDEVLSECRRATSGAFLVISLAEVSVHGLSWPVLTGETSQQHPILTRLARAGWRAQIVASRPAVAEPTPPSAILDGVHIDAFPEVTTPVEWSLAEAT